MDRVTLNKQDYVRSRANFGQRRAKKARSCQLRTRKKYSNVIKELPVVP
ncbi:hypothetical protein [Neobacillus niacini]|nr:hypothetical protein [Neobacillus niacini]